MHQPPPWRGVPNRKRKEMTIEPPGEQRKWSSPLLVPATTRTKTRPTAGLLAKAPPNHLQTRKPPQAAHRDATIPGVGHLETLVTAGIDMPLRSLSRRIYGVSHSQARRPVRIRRTCQPQSFCVLSNCFANRSHIASKIRYPLCPPYCAERLKDGG